MEFIYYLIKNQNIIKKFSENNKDKIKQFCTELLNESDEFDEVEVYRIPFDVNIFDFRQLIRYGENVTCDYINNDDLIIL